MGRELGKAGGAVDCQTSPEREGRVEASKIAGNLRRVWQDSRNSGAKVGHQRIRRPPQKGPALVFLAHSASGWKQPMKS